MPLIIVRNGTTSRPKAPPLAQRDGGLLVAKEHTLPNGQRGYAIRKKMTGYERNDIFGRLTVLREQVADSDSRHLIADPSAINREIRHLEALIERDDALMATGREKDQIVAQLRQIDEELAKWLPPAAIQNTKQDDSGEFERAVQASMRAQAPEVVDLCNKRRELAMRLEPENPDSASFKSITGE